MPYSPPVHRPAFAPTRKQVKQATTKHYNKHKRTGHGFYKTKQWKDLRAWHVNQYPLCIACRDKGRATPVQIVDHIVEIKDGGSPLCVTNLQSMCRTCHNTKTADNGLQRLTTTNRGRAG